MTLFGGLSHRHAHVLGLGLGLSLWCLAATPRLEATPLLALKEANNCDGCHKGGRGQKPYFERRCTLDCQGCHVDPAGGGARNQWGYYYTHADATSFKFFSPQDPLQDTSRFDLHYDGRIIQRDTAQSSRTFPMSSVFTLRVRPFVKYLHLTYENTLLGRVDDEIFRIMREGDRRFREKYSVMVDNLPLAAYVRAYRGTPMYGLRRPNHTLWIRERVGLDQFATTEAVEMGATPNVPFFRVSQMTGDPYVESALRQKGTTYHAGLRGVSYGWHVNTSGWNTKSQTTDIKMNAYGAGANIYNVILYGEQNKRTVAINEELAQNFAPTRIHPSSNISEYTVAYSGIPGVMFGAIEETYTDTNTSSKRRNYFLDLHPIPFLQVEFWRRFETGARRIADNLAILHLYADF